jgi:acyl-coenzyme A thioesterase PaaI-like protein
VIFRLIDARAQTKVSGPLSSGGQENHKLVGEIDVDQRHLNRGGIVHGGALLAFADDLGGTVAGLNIPEGFRTTTIESKSNIFHACPPGRLTGIAVPYMSDGARSLCRPRSYGPLLAPLGADGRARMALRYTGLHAVHAQHHQRQLNC